MIEHRGGLVWRREDGWTWFRLTLPRGVAETGTQMETASSPKVEPPMLRAVLRRESNNKALAAQRIGIHRSTLRQKLRMYELE